MSAFRPIAPPIPETLDARPGVNVSDGEFRRLLGYPKGHTPSERSLELADWARRHYAEYGRPWIYMRRAVLSVGPDSFAIDGERFHSDAFHSLLGESGAVCAVLVAVSAGRSCEDDARKRWRDGKPDEYFFLETFGSAVVESLIAQANGRICGGAERAGLAALPHYSPGYTGWDVSEQRRLMSLVARGRPQPFPELLEALASGMLRPKKSLLAVVGLAPSEGTGRRSYRMVPCVNCSFSPCQYRRAPYWYSSKRAQANSPEHPSPNMTSPASPLSPNARYTVNAKALRKWATERVRVTTSDDGSVEARFRFDGTTCSNLGRPLAFDYVVGIGPASEGYPLRSARCQPAPGDTGHKSMCAYLSDPAAFMVAIEAEIPPLGGPLEGVLDWAPPTAPSGCHCEPGNRAHKWVLALEAIHYTLAHMHAPGPLPEAPGES